MAKLVGVDRHVVRLMREYQYYCGCGYLSQTYNSAKHARREIRKHLWCTVHVVKSRCKKVSYLEETDAMRALNIIWQWEQSDRPKEEIRHYRCPSCRHWHLTSKE